MKTLIAIATLLLFAGCGLTYDCERDSRSMNRQQAITMLNANDVTVTLQDGSRYDGRVVRATNDTLEFQQMVGGIHITIPADKIRTALIHNKNLGPSILGGFFGASGTPDPSIGISFGPDGSGTAVVSEQRGLSVSLEKTIELWSNNGDKSTPDVPASSGSRGGVHR